MSGWLVFNEIFNIFFSAVGVYIQISVYMYIFLNIQNLYLYK